MFAARAGFFTNPGPPGPPIHIPANAVVPYYDTMANMTSGDWTRYSKADGYYIWSAQDQSQIDITYSSVSGGMSANGSTSFAGSHSGSTVTQNVTSNTGGSIAPSASAGASSHNHSFSGGRTDNTDTMLNKQKINLLRSIRATTYFPTNTLVTKQNAAANSTPFVDTGYNYLHGANDNLTRTTGTGYSFTIPVSLSSDSGHYHASASSAYRPMGTGSAIRNYNMAYAGAHSHTAFGTFSQSTIRSKLVNLWKLTSPSLPESDIIIMYVGILTALPTYWKLCNGLNGTPNLGGYIIGYSDNQWDVTTASNAVGALSSTDAPYTPHYHSASYQLYTTNVSGPSAFHSNYGWSHSHTLSGSTFSYFPQRIGVAFIQYKG
jgi:hypothetical protein